MFNIIKGHINEILNKELDLYKYRFEFCKECPLYTKSLIGNICDKNKCIDKDKQYTQENKTDKSICGCGCRLEAKLRLKDEQCILKKW